MKQRKSKLAYASLAGIAFAISVASPQTLAKTITLMQLGDTHGHMHSHPEIFPDGRVDPDSGGLAKLTTLINEVRADNPDSLLLAVGDTTHASAAAGSSASPTTCTSISTSAMTTRKASAPASASPV